MLARTGAYSHADVSTCFLQETWYDPDYDEICTLEKLPKDRLPWPQIDCPQERRRLLPPQPARPPLHRPFIGMKLDPGECTELEFELEAAAC